ncbi:MAG: phage baseplate assembly protein V [Caldilineaceae bacterium]
MYREQFDIAVPGVFGTSYLATVVSVDDTQKIGRVQVRLYAYDGPSDQDGPLWARVATPFAGNNRGAFMLPDVGDEVIVTCINGDPRQAVVFGSLWNGHDAPPDQLPGKAVDRWTIVGKAGTRIAIVEESASTATIKLSTPGGVTAEYTDASGGKVEIKAAGTTITVDTQGVSVQTGGKVKVQASNVEVTAGMVKVDAGMSKFSGIVQCDTLISNSVLATTYTPGAGNVW